MRMVFLGAPGVGKGTQAELAAPKFWVPKISTGDLLRAAVVQGTPLGREAKAYMDRGDLVPDQVVIGLVEEKVGAPECTKGFILDGFPRTVPQADRLSELLMARGQSLDKVVCFLPVIFNEWRRLLLIHGKPRPDRFLPVIISLN